MNTHIYYNTTNLSGELLLKAERLASAQDKFIFSVFVHHQGKLLSSHDVEDFLENKYPRSSIVRSINTLTKKGLIEKTNKTKIGKYGKPVYLWGLVEEGPRQLNLFNS